MWKKPPLRTFLSSLLLMVALLALGAMTALGQSGQTIVISDGLQPATLEVSAGTTVTWQNEDDERRRIRSREGPVAFDSGNLEPGESFTFTFVVEGTYPYLDERDEDGPAYHGRIVVVAAEVIDAASRTARVTIVDEAFHPPALEVATGTTVEWAHLDGDEQHTVTSSDGIFDSGLLVAGQTFRQTFDSPGVFPYVCAIHPDMRGTITVSEAEGAAVVGPAASDAGPPATDAAGASDDPPVVDASPAAEVPPTADTSPGADEPTVELSPLPTEGAMPPGAAEATVSIADMLYQPAMLEVPAGTTVRWSNDDTVIHTVTARDGSFNSGVLAIGTEFRRTFDVAGTFDYFCAVHPLQTGRIVVTAAAPDSTGSAEDAATGDAAPAAESLAEAAVSIIDLAFEPATVEVPAGTTVRWSNRDSVGHTVTAVDGTYDSGLLTVGAEFGRAFEEPGTFEYFCAIHPEMRGRVIVATAAIEGG